MLFRLLLLFTVVPLVELWLLFGIAKRTSIWFTIALVLVTGFVGAALARWQGWRTVTRIQDELRQGHLPAGALVDGVLILVAGVLLITPGVLTDSLGFLLLIPPCRTLVKAYLARRFQYRIQTYRDGFRAQAWSDSARSPFDDGPFESDQIIDSHVIDAEPPDDVESSDESGSRGSREP